MPASKKRPSRRTPPTKPATRVDHDEIGDTLRVDPPGYDRMDDHERELVQALLGIRVRQMTVDRELQECVEHMRNGHSISWAAIAWATGMTPEGARLKWRDS